MDLLTVNGKTLTDADFEALVAEAEAGYQLNPTTNTTFYVRLNGITHRAAIDECLDLPENWPPHTRVRQGRGWTYVYVGTHADRVNVLSHIQAEAEALLGCGDPAGYIERRAMLQDLRRNHWTRP